MGARRAISGVATIAGLALAGCASVPLGPAPSPPAPEIAAPAAIPAPRSDASRDLERYYARVQTNLLSQGLLRTDDGATDAPFTADMLARNFERIALFEEYATVGGAIVARETESRLHRWTSPVRLEVSFGDTVDPAKATADQAAIRTYLARLSRLAGLPITQVKDNPNFLLFVVTEDERRALGPRLRAFLPGLSEAAIQTVTDLDRSSYCLVFAIDPGRRGIYDRAVAIVRAEHPDLLRLSCIHEELAQGLGLANDSPEARPSVFNDDEEFALLTPHDEYLIRMLYHPSLSPGMTADEARPLVRTLAEDLVGGAS